ncbi:MAE_28990/MAE_18760 family HEPN-like nuclease [Methylobacterium sp. NFXW15]|uniref:MAE_28990/MAE_18760 family HEPN-like nuclease n=1 Tax=Methylobacterium sp. NFXW15 TaxID=2819512 RepID=UPI003CEC5D1F
MSKPYTEDELSNQIAEDRAWRIREISDLKSATRRADINLRTVLLRAVVTLCYAHWEGSVRFAARKYFEHIALRRLRFAELDRQFLRNYFMPRLAALSRSNTSIVDRCNLVDQILNSGDERFGKVNDDLINTQSNLNSFVVCDICLVCGVDSKYFHDESDFIDILLLKRRNAIAHGEETYIQAEDLDNITEKTIDLMRTFGDLIENNIFTKSYRS